MMIYLPQDVELIISRLNQNGFKAYTVGGCVRDSLMGKAPHDWDICTSAAPEQISDLFSDFKLLTMGEKHGTITVTINHIPYEVTTFRIDGDYCDNRRPESVEFVSDLYEDLKRRDFTVNAIAYHPSEGLCDPFGGCDDIKNKIIRCVGEPDKRFGEDALRIMRAIRFSAVLGFKIEDETGKSILKSKHLLKNIASERIRSEFEKILLSDSIDIYSDFHDVFGSTVGEYANGFTDAVTGLDKILPLRLAAYYLDKADDIKSILCNLRFDKKTVCRTSIIISNFNIEIEPDIPCLRRLISIYGYDTVYDIILFKSAFCCDLRIALGLLDEIKEKNLCCTVSQLDINGRDLDGMVTGRQTGAMLNRLLELVISDSIENEKSILINEAKRIYKEGLE